MLVSHHYAVIQISNTIMITADFHTTDFFTGNLSHGSVGNKVGMRSGVGRLAVNHPWILGAHSLPVDSKFSENHQVSGCIVLSFNI